MELSRRRQKILQIILPQVVPSAYGSKAFKRIDAGWAPGAGYTTCGGLPAFVARQLGLDAAGEKTGIGIGGLAGMRNAGIVTKSWVHNGTAERRNAGAAAMRPKPGDFYLLCSGDSGRHESGCNCISPVRPEDYHKWRGAKVEHVGVIVSAEGQFWKTADAGQGGSQQQMALYVYRQFHPVTQQITGESDKYGKPMRRLCGWLDVDRFPFRG